MKIPAGSLSSGKSNLSDTSFVARAENFRSQVELYKQLALNSPMTVTKEDQEEHKKDLKFLKDELSRVFDKELDDFSKENFDKPDQYFHQRVAALATFMYLYDKLLELGQSVNSKKTVGIYSIYDDVMAGLFALLSVRFFIRPLSDVIRDYLEIEPILVACAELTDTELEPIQDVAGLYREKLGARVAAILEPEKKKRMPKKPKPKISKKRKAPKKTSKKKARTKSRKTKKKEAGKKPKKK